MLSLFSFKIFRYRCLIMVFFRYYSFDILSNWQENEIIQYKFGIFLLQYFEWGYLLVEQYMFFRSRI